MNLKEKIYISIVIIGIVFVSNCRVYGQDKDAKVSSLDQPFIFNATRSFRVGFLEKGTKNRMFGNIPRIKGEKIYDSIIKDNLSDPYGQCAMMSGGWKVRVFEKNIGKFCFFTGYYKSYHIFRLRDENPHNELIEGRSSPYFSVFEIEQILPIENNENVFSILPPDAIADEFEIQLTVKNTLSRSLYDSLLHVEISGAFEILEGESYYTKDIEEKYESGGIKVYTFRIKRKDERFCDKKDFEISFVFMGCGKEGDPMKPELFPLYSKKSFKGKLQCQWVQVQ